MANQHNGIDDLHDQVRELRDNLKDYARQTDDKQAAALCETGGEMVGGLEAAFDHYIDKSEEAWQ